MARTVTVTLDEKVYNDLATLATLEGQSAEEWVRRAVERLVEDPLVALAGSFDSGISDLADRHDEHLGEALAQPRE